MVPEPFDWRRWLRHDVPIGVALIVLALVIYNQ